MKCYYHQDIDAVGICKSCSRGICPECAVEVGEHGIACKGRCENEVGIINRLFQWSKTSHQKTGGAYSRSAMIWAVLGISFILFGIYQWQNDMKYFLIPGGIILLFGAVSQLYTSQKFHRDWDDERQ